MWLELLDKALISEESGEDFTGIFVDSKVVEGLTDKTVIDVFGYKGKIPTVLRIVDWKPKFLVLTPACVDPKIFAEELGAKDIREMPDFSGFDFGMHRTYVEIECLTMKELRKNKAVEVFGKYRSNVEQMRQGTVDSARGCRLPNSILEEIRHFNDAKTYPLRYTTADAVSHFMTQEHIPLVGHLKVKGEPFNPREVGIKYDHGIIASYKDVSIATTEHHFKEALVCSYDLETMGLDPKPTEAYIISIGMAFYRVGKNIPEATVVLIDKKHPADPEEGMLFVECDGEAGMIAEFANILERYKISILTGFNIDEFDTKYIYIRAMQCGLSDRLTRAFSYYEDSPAAFRHNEKFKLDGGDVTGLHRFVSNTSGSVDAILRLKKLRPKEFQEGNNLNMMLAWYDVKDPQTGLDARKEDLPYDEMFAVWKENTPAGNRLVYKYCAHDAKMTYVLLYWINFFITMFELSVVSYTTLNDSFHRADGKRVSRRLETVVHEAGFAFCTELHDFRPKEVQGELLGGDVRSLRPGPVRFVNSLDYKSEYPAQKEAFNIGTATKVDPDIIENYAAYGLELVQKDIILDQYCTKRERYFFRAGGKTYEVQQFLAEAMGYDGKLIQWKTYYAQSPRENGQIIEHYSPQAKFLTDLRFLRDRMKKLGSEAKTRASKLSGPDKAKALADAIIYDVRQNVVKTLMNTEYGTNNASTAAHWDQDTAATVTWCSRRLAEFLRKLLTVDSVTIPDPIDISKITQYGFSIEPTEKHDPYLIDEKIILEKRPVKQWWKVKLRPCDLVYQDTDSNYYLANAIIDYHSGMNDPLECVKTTWHAILNYNDIMATILEMLVDRWPIGVSCDGGGTVGYWSNNKKQYMMLKGPETHSDVDKMTNAHLFPDLTDRRPGEAIAQFLQRKKIKVTGYQLIRRETPDYIINYLLELISAVLNFGENGSMLALARGIVEKCKIMLKTEPNMLALSKQQKYRPTSENDVKRIVQRLITEKKEDFIPAEFSVARYVLMIPERFATDSAHARAFIQHDRKTDRMYLLNEIPVEGMTLDVPYYLKKMARALANIVFEEILVEQNEQELLMAYYDKKEAAVDKCIKKAVLHLMRPHYTIEGSSHGKEFAEVITKVAEVTSSSRKSVKKIMDVSFDKSTPAGELAEQIVKAERAPYKDIIKAKDYYIRMISLNGVLYGIQETQRVAEEVLTAYRGLINAYVKAIECFRTFDARLCSRVIESRKFNSPTPLAAIRSILPGDSGEVTTAMNNLEFAAITYRYARVRQAGLIEATKKK